MKFSLSFKTPDVTDQIEGSEDEIESAREFLERWLEYNEYVTIDFDTKKGTATVRGCS